MGENKGKKKILYNEVKTENKTRRRESKVKRGKGNRGPKQKKKEKKMYKKKYLVIDILHSSLCCSIAKGTNIASYNKTCIRKKRGGKKREEKVGKEMSKEKEERREMWERRGREGKKGRGEGKKG